MKGRDGDEAEDHRFPTVKGRDGDEAEDHRFPTVKGRDGRNGDEAEDHRFPTRYLLHKSIRGVATWLANSPSVRYLQN